MLCGLVCMCVYEYVLSFAWNLTSWRLYTKGKE
jgi:hypothetical protein